MNSFEYLKLTRDSKRELEVLKWLRSQDEIEKFKFIWSVLRENPYLGLPLVERSQLNVIHLELILEYGFVYGDASSVRQWYEATVKGLGESKVIQMIRSHIDNAPLIVEKMLYWINPSDDKLIVEINMLRREFKEKYPNFKSTQSTGIHPTGVV